MESFEIKLTDLERIFSGEVPASFFLEIIFRTAFVYLILIISMRLMGKRMSSTLQRNELAAIGDPVDERITKGTVKGLRARIALFRGGYSLRQTGAMARKADYLTYYQIAKDECNDIINSKTEFFYRSSPQSKDGTTI